MTDEVPRHRPPWWPEGEPFPPAGRPPWASRRYRRRPIGCFFVIAATVMVSIGIVVLWALATVLGATGAEGELARLGRVAATFLLVAVFLAIVTGAGMGRRVVRPVGELIDAARRIEAGDYGVRVTEPPRPRELRDLTVAFNTMAERLEAEEATRRRLLADLSHELRTPIAVIEGHLEAVLDGVYPADAAHLDPILDETRVLDRLIDDLRTLSLAEAGALALHREATDIGHVIDDVVAAHRPRAEAGGAGMETEVEPGIPELELDPVRMHQVLANLVDNAVRYTPAGGRVRVSAHRVGDRLEVSVIDQGPGLAPDVRASLFDRFVKARDSPGSGLGLAIARAIVEAHDGRIRADAGPGGVGTAVSFSLPIASGSAG